jgi:hypothetical protein
MRVELNRIVLIDDFITRACLPRRRIMHSE